MLEERKLYLEEHPTKGNGYYTRDLLTLFGPLEDHKVPRVREGDFHPKLLPYRRRTSIELSETILALYASRASTRDISRDSVRGVPLPREPPFSPKWWRMKSRRNRPLAREYYAIYLDGTFLSVRRGKAAKEPVYLALGIRPDGRREIFSSSKWQLCVLHTVRNTLAKTSCKMPLLNRAAGGALLKNGVLLLGKLVVVNEDERRTPFEFPVARAPPQGTRPYRQAPGSPLGDSFRVSTLSVGS